MALKSSFNGILQACLASFLLLFVTGCLGGFNGFGNPPAVDFTISVSPGAQAVTAGQSTAFTINVSSSGGHVVTLSVDGLPPGSAGAFSSGVAAGPSSTSFSIITSDRTFPGTFQLTIAGNDVTGSQSIIASITVNPAPPPDFTLGVTPNMQNTLPGGSATYKVSVNSSASSPVNLSVADLPAGITASFDTNSITGSGIANLTLSTQTTTALSLYNFVVIGTDPSGTQNVGASLTVVGMDFSFSSQLASAAVTAGGTVTGNLTLTPVVGSPGPVVLSVTSPLPQGVVVNFNPSVVVLGTSPASTALTITTSTTTPPSDSTFTIQASDASGSQVVQIPINIVSGNPAAGFFLAVNPTDQTVNAGFSANYSLNVTTAGTPLPDVTLSVQGFPGGTTVQVNPTGPGTFQLTVSAAANATPGLADLTIDATGPNGSQSLIVTLTVNQVCIDCPPPPPPD